MYRGNSTPDVRITNTYPWTLFAMRAAFGGRVSQITDTTSKGRALWQWTISGEGALTVCRTTAPLLIEKRAQAELVLEIRRYPKHSATRLALLKQLKDLKRITYA